MKAAGTPAAMKPVAAAGYHNGLLVLWAWQTDKTWQLIE